MRKVCSILSVPSSLALCSLLFAGAIQAANFQKANNTTYLNDPNSWVSLAVPGSGDSAQWDNTVTAANTVGLGAAASWGGIIVTNPGGNVTITNDGNTLTLGANGVDLSGATKDLSLICPVIFSSTQILTVTNNRNLYFSNSISGGASGFTKNGGGTVLLLTSNNFSGPITLNAGTLTLANSNAWPGASALTFKGGVLGINSGVIVTNLTLVTTNTTATLNVSCSGILPNNLTINPGTNSASPNANATPIIPTGWVQVNLSGSVSAGGFITNNGTLVLNSGSTPTLGTIVGSGNLGGIQDKATPAAGHTLTFGNGSAFSYYQPFSNSISPTTLQIAGNGSVSFKWFGYNDAAGIVYTNILNGGTWLFGSVGQNNSSAHFAGTCLISNNASVTITNNVKYVHGTWNAGSNSSLTFIAPTASDSLTAGHNGNNIGLNLGVSDNSSLNVLGGNGLQLAFGQTTPNTAAETNSLTVNGGYVFITNNLTLGVVGENKSSESDIVTLNGGKLLVSGTLAPSGGTLAPQTNASPYAPVYPNNIFNWTGGQLSAATINVSNGVAISTLTNVTTVISTTNPAIISGSFSTTALTNHAGVLAPGDDGIPGRTLINNGGYVQTDGGTLAIDLGGINRAATFQTNVVGYYDYLQAAGPVVLGGSLKVKLVGGYVPAYTDQLIIISTTGSGNLISGTFTNLIPGGGNLGRVPVEGVPGAYFSVVTNSSITSLYLIDYTNLTSTASYPTNITANVISGGTTLALSWPATHLGWTLQAQTNSLSVGLTTNGWVDVPGTATVTGTNLPIVPSNPSVFYRLRN